MQNIIKKWKFIYRVPLKCQHPDLDNSEKVVDNVPDSKFDPG